MGGTMKDFCHGIFLKLFQISVISYPTVFAGFDGISSQELANLNKAQLKAFAAIFSDLSKTEEPSGAVLLKRSDNDIASALNPFNYNTEDLFTYGKRGYGDSYMPQTYNSFKRSWGADDSLGSFMHQFSLSSVPSKRLMPMMQIPNLQADFSGKYSTRIFKFFETS